MEGKIIKSLHHIVEKPRRFHRVHNSELLKQISSNFGDVLNRMGAEKMNEKKQGKIKKGTKVYGYKYGQWMYEGFYVTDRTYMKRPKYKHIIDINGILKIVEDVKIK